MSLTCVNLISTIPVIMYPRNQTFHEKKNRKQTNMADCTMQIITSCVD